MNVELFNDAKAFATATLPYLLRDEAENCFWLGMIDEPHRLQDALMCMVRDGDAMPIVGIKTPGRQIVLTRGPTTSARLLAQFLHERGTELPGVGGDRDSAQAFSEVWTNRSKTVARVQVRLGLYQLTQVAKPDPTPGAMRFPEERDLELLARWIDAFSEELDEPLPGGRTIARERIDARSIFLWELGGQPVAMAGFSGKTPHGVRINLVYTPPALRGNGYASNLVASLSQHLLDSGRRFCFLFTDLANPISNKIYRTLGYEFLSESVHIMFDGATRSH